MSSSAHSTAWPLFWGQRHAPLYSWGSGPSAPPATGHQAVWLAPPPMSHSLVYDLVIDDLSSWKVQDENPGLLCDQEDRHVP